MNGGDTIIFDAKNLNKGILLEMIGWKELSDVIYPA